MQKNQIFIRCGLKTFQDPSAHKCYQKTKSYIYVIDVCTFSCPKSPYGAQKGFVIDLISALFFYPIEIDKILEFRNFRYKEKAPFIIYGDFESILTSTGDETSKAYNLHETFSIGMLNVCGV